MVTGGAIALLVGAPLGVVAHGQSGDDNREDRRFQQHPRGDNDRSSRVSTERDRDKHHRDDDFKHKTCQERQTLLNQKVAAFKASAQKDITFQTSFYVFLQGFVDTQGINVDNYAGLKADVEARQVTAAQTVDVVTAPDLNCDEQNPNLDDKANSTFREARKALREYKKSMQTLTQEVWVSYNSQMDIQ